MKKLLLVVFVLSLFLISKVSAQNMIGDSKSEIIQYHKTKYPELIPDITKSSDGTDVVIFHHEKNSHAFFIEIGMCTSIRNFYYSYNLLNMVINNLNKNFSPSGDNTWIEYGKNADYQYILVRTDDLFYVDIVIAKIH